MSAVIDIKQVQAAREHELLTPTFPKDISHFDDGTWLCPPVSLQRLSRNFKRFGFELNPLCSFSELHETFSFVLQTASLIRYLGQQWVADEQPPAMMTYLRAVEAGDEHATAEALANVAVPKAPPSTQALPVGRPTLTLVV